MRVALLYLAFFLSGAAGLAYEAVWSRYLGLFVGHDALAQVAVLIIFLGGMAGGSALVATRTERISRPIVWYGVVEVIIGLAALVFHESYLVVSGLAYDSIFPALGDGSTSTIAKWLLACGIILPQSLLLGATFPLMSAGVIRLRPNGAGRVLAWLYFTNSLGAAIGVLVAGFVLIGEVGLPGTVIVAGTINLIVGLLALLVGLRLTPGNAPSIADTYAAASTLSDDRLPRLLLLTAFGTAVASFIYEIAWIRMLSLVLGSSTHSFELMLSAFILGLAIGALCIRSQDRIANPIRVLGTIQVVMGVLAVATLPLYAASFDWLAALMRAFTLSDSGYVGFSIVRYGICLIVMLPATICAGMTLPLITKSLIATGQGEAAIGKVYGWNTLGSIVGVVLAGLLLLPLIGLKSVLILGATLDIAIGVLSLVVATGWRHAVVAALAGASSLALVTVAVPLHQQLLSSGVYRTGQINLKSEILHYADGRTATIAVHRGSDNQAWISTNGKPDASLGPWWWQSCEQTDALTRLGGDESTQLLLPLVTQAYVPSASRAAIIGFGSGMSTHFLLADSGLEKVATIEIEPEMVRAASLFLPINSRAYSDPRSTVVHRDAKAHFAGSTQGWNVIISEPSNPWVSGVSGLFTEEFYRRVEAALTKDGVFGQWLQAYELSDELVLVILAAIDQVFPSWRLHQVGNSDLLVIASKRQSLPPIAAESVFSSSALQEDLCRFVPLDPDDIHATLLAEADLIRPVLKLIGQPNSDFHPALDLGAERSRYLREVAAGTLSLGYDWFSLANALLDTPVSTSVNDALALEDIARIRESWARQQLPLTHSTDPALQAPIGVMLRWRAAVESSTQPVSWREFLDQERSASLVLHAGIAGEVNHAHFREAISAAEKLGAPEGVIQVLRFREGVQSWNADATLAAANRLLEIGGAQAWISSDELRDGTVVMALRSGRIALAHDWYELLDPLSERSRADLRSLLLAGWILSSGPGGITQ